MYFGPMFLDQYYLLLIFPAMLISLFAQMNVMSAFNRYKQVFSAGGQTAERITRKILDSNGLADVRVERVGGSLSDHYDPRENVIRLSGDVYGSSSIAAIGVAAHEAGHAVQHGRGYAPIRVRNAFVPVANIGSRLSFPVILLGFVFSLPSLVMIGVWMFAGILLFQLVTLPVEFNASARAIATLEQQHFLDADELAGAKKVLTAAALTYVAAMIMTIAQLARIVMMTGIFRRRD